MYIHLPGTTEYTGESVRPQSDEGAGSQALRHMSGVFRVWARLAGTAILEADELVCLLILSSFSFHKFTQRSNQPAHHPTPHGVHSHDDTMSYNPRK